MSVTPTSRSTSMDSGSMTGSSALGPGLPRWYAASETFYPALTVCLVCVDPRVRTVSGDETRIPTSGEGCWCRRPALRRTGDGLQFRLQSHVGVDDVIAEHGERNWNDHRRGDRRHERDPA